MNSFWQRLYNYALLRLKEPTTWAGIFLICHALFGWNPSMEMQTAIALLGEGLVGSLLVVAREGRNVADNPSMLAAVKGELPAPAPKIAEPPKP